MTEPLTLIGCTPEPMMSYLKGLGVFRLVAEQADPTAQLSWQGRVAQLSSKFDRDGLTAFLLNDYRPTPVFNPWGGRSGFYPDSSEKKARKALDAIRQAKDSRFDLYKQTIAAVQNILIVLGVEKKEDLDVGDNYIRLLRACRNELPDAALPWLDAVVVLTDDGRKFPPLLGTGGNEGSGSYTSNYAQAVSLLLIERKRDAALASALFGVPSIGLDDWSIGAFDPSGVDGPNSSVGFGGGGRSNVWDYLFAIEGTLLFAGAAARRFGTDTQGRAAFPFTVLPSPVGYTSAVAKEATTEGQKAPSRAELWMPIWERSVCLPELRQLLAEGRAQLGRRQARTGVEFARAVVSLGISHRISSFVRYGVFKRNGDIYFASSLGEFPVRTVTNADLLRQLDPWLSAFEQAAKADTSPPRFAATLRRVNAAKFDICRYGSDPLWLQAVIRAVGRAEAELAAGAKVRADYPRLRPLGGLGEEWVAACDDGSPEFRLATSLAFMSGNDTVGAFRSHLEPVTPINRRLGRWAFDEAPRGVVWANVDLPADLSATLAYRMRTGTSGNIGQSDDRAVVRHPLWTAPRFRPRLTDVLAFLDERTDDVKLAELVWGLSAVRSPKPRTFRFRRPESVSPTPVPAEYAVTKLVFLTESVRRPGPGPSTPTPIHNEPRVIPLLRAGRTTEAVAVACRRLLADGFPTMLAGPVGGRGRPLTGLRGSPVFARRLLAALLFPLGRVDSDRLSTIAIRPFEE